MANDENGGMLGGTGIMPQTGLLLNLRSNKYLWKSRTENAINPFFPCSVRGILPTGGQV